MQLTSSIGLGENVPRVPESAGFVVIFLFGRRRSTEAVVVFAGQGILPSEVPKMVEYVALP